ncbi:MAG: hypothetical protein E7254_11340 [Lachnospiraceae bacterium]|nr:hypothetical protein [Lachnospiraceae bacterium]
MRLYELIQNEEAKEKTIEEEFATSISLIKNNIDKCLSFNEVVKSGREFNEELCWSGEYGQQVYVGEMEEGGVPFEGILYEYKNGKISYYSDHVDGYDSGEFVEFYDSGELQSYAIMDLGARDGAFIEWYKNGKIKKEGFSRYGVRLIERKYDELGNLINEKKVTDEERKRYYESKKIYGD